MRKRFLVKVSGIFLFFYFSFFAFSFTEAKETEKFFVSYEGIDMVQSYYVPDGLSVQEAMDIFVKQNSSIEAIEADYSYEAAFFPNDEGFWKQWYLLHINIPDVWDRIRPKEEIIVAVLDTGVDISHEELQSRLWKNEKEIPDDGIDNDGNGFVDDVHGWDFVNFTNQPIPMLEEPYIREGIIHGTLISGIIGAHTDNMKGGAGMSSHVKIMPLRVLDNFGIGEASSVVNAITYAKNQGADIINLSFVGSENSFLLKKAIRDAYNHGILIVAAAGNDKKGGGINLDEMPMYPICHDLEEEENFIIGVASTDQEDIKSDFSNYGDCVDISAPGQDFFGLQFVDATSPDFQESFGGPWAGTSLAAPLISGMAALLKSQYPHLSPKALTDIILSSTTNIDHIIGNASYRTKLGRGRLNAFKAFLQAKKVQHLSLPPSLPSNFTFFVAPASQRVGDVLIYDQNGEKQNQIQVYDAQYTKGVQLASGDIDGDGRKDIITSPNEGGGPHVRIFSEDGMLISHFMAFDAQTRSGVRIAACDVNRDGKDEIIVAAGEGMPPFVRIFHHKSKFSFGYSEFLVYNTSYTGGVYVACADTDGDGFVEIITSILSNNESHIRLFQPDGLLYSQFIAFTGIDGSKAPIIACDVNDDGKAEILISHEKGGDSRVRIFHQKTPLLYRFNEFFAYGTNFKGGVSLGCGDIDRDGDIDIITGAGIGGGPHVRWFTPKGTVIGQLFAFEESFHGGVNVSAF